MGPRVRAVTIEEYEARRRGGGGGGRGPDGEGWLSRLWIRWASSLVSAKVSALETLESLTPQQFVDLGRLKAEFDRVSRDPGDAYRAVARYSLVLNNPLVGPLLRS